MDDTEITTRLAEALPGGYRDFDRDELAAALLPVVREIAAGASTGVVYYAWIPQGVPRIGGTVKIGYSASVHQRMASIGADLLASEPGDRRLESARHREYAHLRVEREYFRPADDLWQRVEALAGHRVERL